MIIIKKDISSIFPKTINKIIKNLETVNKFKNDIERSIELFNNLFNYNTIFFSYPFGEYSLEQKNYISSKFEYAFGQHSGVIDLNKDPYELPRFPINEKYGDLKRFEFLIKLAAC